MNTYFTKRKISFLIPLFTLFSTILFAQNTSNKGTDFWLGYTGHIDGTTSKMNLYITSDISTSGTVSIPLNGWSTNFTVTANNTTIVPVPSNIAYDGNSGTVLNQGIHVTADLPIVVYSHIYASNRSDATLVLPVPTLGKEYYTMGFTQTNAGSIFGGSVGYAEFMVVGVQDSSQVQITPTQTTTDGHQANVPFNITLNQGQVYQLQAATDLTGSHIVTYTNNTTACARIAVFSGSTWDVIGCAGGTSGDNLYQQLYPVNAWGNNFITAPFKSRTGGDYFRVLAGSDSTLVSVNGNPPFLLNTAQFHDTLMTTANYITATKPITLAQYQLTQQGCNHGTGDPSMTILNPVEQTLDTISLYSTLNYNITEEYINVIIQAVDTSAFRLDGNHVPFTVVPANPLYAYSQNTVTSGNHTLASDSGFNAIAYGFGNVESYGYSAGANVKNLVQFVSAGSNGISNPHILCNGATVNFTGVVSYKPTTLKWYFGDGDTSTTPSPVHTYASQGTYIVSFVTTRGAGGSCDVKDSSTYTLNIVGFPTAAFNFSNTCVSDTVSFTDGSTAGGGTIVSWKWYFGDGDSSTIKNPFHHYASAGNYNVQLIIKSNGGCTNTITKQVSINAQPAINAGPDQTICLGSPAILSTTTGNGYTYQWSPAVNLSCSTCSSTNASPSDTQVYVIRTTLSGCSNYDTVKVSVIKPLADITPDSVSMCAGNSVVIYTATKGSQTYSWSPSNGLSCTTCYITNASPTKTTKYFVTATYNSCQAKDSIVVQVFTPGTSADTSICPGGSPTLQAFPNSPGFSYQWSPSTGLSCLTCQSTIATPASLPSTYYVVISSSTCNANDSVVITEVKVPANAGKDTTICAGGVATLDASGGVGYQWSPNKGLSSSTGASPSASPTVNTTYTVVVTDSKGCHGHDSVAVKLYPPFVATAAPDTIVCPGQQVMLKATGGVSYAWQPSDSLIGSTTANPIATVNAYTVFTVAITDQKRCIEDVSVTVAVFDLPLIYATPSDTIICKNKPLQITASGANSYVWSGAEILSCNTCATVNVGTQNSGTFTVTATDANGCKNTAEAAVLLSPYCQFVLMPDAFTPNDDGHNDLFRPVGKGIIKVEYSVFDRWGKKVFTGKDLINGWDGKYNGTLQPVGTYVWVLSADLDDGTSVTQEGNVTLIR